MNGSSKRFVEVLLTGLGTIFNSRKFIGIIIFLFLINTLPSLVAYIIALKKPAYVFQQFLAQFYATWLILLISNIFSIILPLFITNIVFSDQIRLRRIFNILIRPIRREFAFVALEASIVLAHTLIGLMLGLYLFVTVGIGSFLAGKNVWLTPEIIFQLVIFLTITSFLYSAMMTSIILVLRDYGLRSIILFFIIALVYDLVLSAIGGSYNLLTINYYKLSILANTISDRGVREKIIDFSPISLGDLYWSISILVILSTIFFAISLKKFIELDVT